MFLLRAFSTTGVYGSGAPFSWVVQGTSLVRPGEDGSAIEDAVTVPYTSAMSRILLTGTRRIGRVIGEHLLRDGHDLVVVYRTSRKVAETLREKGASLGRQVDVLQANLGQPGEGTRVAREAREKGPVHGLVHLASPYRRVAFGSVEPTDLLDHFYAIAGSLVEMTQVLVQDVDRSRKEVQFHAVVFGDWAVDTSPYPDYLPYFLAKGALHAAVRALAKEMAPWGVVNAIAPGPVWRPPDLPESTWQIVLDKTPLRREVSLEEIVELTRFLLSTTSITGEIIRMDGGRHLAGSGLRPE